MTAPIDTADEYLSTMDEADTVSGSDTAEQDDVSGLSDAAYSERNAISTLLITLARGVIFADDGAKQWNALMRYQNQVRQQAAMWNLALHLDPAEGYAFFRNTSQEGEGDDLPRLMPRRQLNFHTSLLLALLRRRMVEFDTSNESQRLVFSHEEITTMMLTFQPNNPDQAKLVESTETAIIKVVEMGFLNKIKATYKDQPPAYEVRRILKAFIDAQWLNEFDAKLAEYARAASNKE